ncbi:MAG TPA: hypothetical protein VHD87_15465 [Acidimicrobiales bacterium]|nr:hypothetical protein [Acidimicrobiales bacterium]
MGRAAKQRRGVLRRSQPGARMPAIGIDVGGVLVDRVGENSDTSFFGDRPMDTPMVAGAHDAVAAVLELFAGRVYIVSKAGPKIAELSRKWLALHGLTGPDAIPTEHVHFVRERVDKAQVCRQLGITHFVDDRADVLAHLDSVDHRYLFLGGLGAHEPPPHSDAEVVRVESWARLTGILAGQLAASATAGDRAANRR